VATVAMVIALVGVVWPSVALAIALSVLGMYNYWMFIGKNPSTAACFSGACREKARSSDFGSDWKDRGEESEAASETEVSG